MRRGVKNLSAITRFRYNRDTQSYSRRFFSDVSCYFDNRYSTGKGLEYSGSVTLRVFSDEDIDVKAGDRIVLSYCADERPPASSHEVVAVTDNRRAYSPRMRHWRITCGVVRSSARAR